MRMFNKLIYKEFKSVLKAEGEFRISKNLRHTDLDRDKGSFKTKN